MFSLPFPLSTIDAVKTRRKHENTRTRKTNNFRKFETHSVSLSRFTPPILCLPSPPPPASATKAATFRSRFQFKLLISPTIIGIISLHCRLLNCRNLWFLRRRSWSLQDWQGPHIVGENSIAFILRLV